MDTIQQLEQEFSQKLSDLTPETAEMLRIEYLGRKGKITQLLHRIGELPPEERKGYGQSVNALKQKVEAALTEHSSQSGDTRSQKSNIDITLPGVEPEQGSCHPITQTIEEFIRVFQRMGFEIVDGREVETEKYNFTALNIPIDHPARDAFDTFYTEKGHLLRSQTSTVQVRVMENRKPPLRIIAPGRVYRPDEIDASHSSMFHQVEGFMVDEKITFADLKGVLRLFLTEIFGKEVKIRFRPHFFPFTEPSVEVDMMWVRKQITSGGTVQKSQWLEILGAGQIHPNVFKAAGYPKGKYRGFAFGLGVERMAMLRLGINDIRYFYENNLDFLSQF